MDVSRTLSGRLILLLCACGITLAQPPPIPANGSTPPVPVTVEAPKATPTTAATVIPVDTRTYVIGPEDILFIRVWREDSFTGQYVVRPDGKITLPLIRDVQAEGLTPERLGAQLAVALSEFINQPDVTVSVNQVNSKKFYISGMVNRPGQYPLVVSLKIFDALNAAGGFRDFANTKNITIVRGDKRLKFNYNEVKDGKKLEQNIAVENGDTLIVN